MTQHIPKEFFSRLTDWSSFVIMGQHDAAPRSR